MGFSGVALGGWPAQVGGPARRPTDPHSGLQETIQDCTDTTVQEDRRPVPVEVFIDESRRSDYLLAAVAVDSRDLKAMRAATRRLLLPRERRLHFAKETASRRRGLLDQMARQGCAVGIFVCRSPDRVARALLLEAVVSKHRQELRRLVLESRAERDVIDQRQLIATRLSGLFPHNATFEHLLPYEEPLLWIADAAAWAWGAGGDWRRRADPMIAEVVRIGA
jgi:hypothetical protein